MDKILTVNSNNNQATSNRNDIDCINFILESLNSLDIKSVTRGILGIILKGDSIFGIEIDHNLFTLLNNSELAKALNISRQTIYNDKKNARKFEKDICLLKECAKKVNPSNLIQYTKTLRDKLILSCALYGNCSIDACQSLLKAVMNKHISTGSIHNILERAGKFAKECNDSENLSEIKQGVHDEIYEGDQPILTGIDAQSTYTYLMAITGDRTADSWQLVMDHLRDNNQLNLDVSISDNGNGMRSGIPRTFPNIEFQLDIFHLFKEIRFNLTKIENSLFKSIEFQDKYSTHSYYKHKKEIDELNEKLPTQLSIFDQLKNDFDEIHRLVTDISNLNRSMIVDKVRTIITRMISLIHDSKSILGCYGLSYHLRRFMEHLPHALNYLERMQKKVDHICKEQNLIPYVFDLLLKRRNYEIQQDSTKLEEIVKEFRHLVRYDADRLKYENLLSQILQTIKRGSGMVENLNSRIRRFINSKRLLSENFLSLLQLFINTKTYKRSRIKDRKGKNPMSLLKNKTIPDFLDFMESKGFWRMAS